MADLTQLADAIIRGDQGTATAVTRDALADGSSAESILNEGLIAGMEVLGARFKRNEVYVPEVLIAARAMKMAMEVLEPELAKAGVKPVSRFLIGTVRGDLHDIGKNLVAMMLKGAGFEVVDLGVDIPPEKFVERAKETDAQLIGMSALLTTTMPAMEETVEALKAADISAKVIVGGAPVTQGYADKIGADGFAPEAASAVDLAKALLVPDTIRGDTRSLNILG
ncbi:MAG: corrinoid protein [Phycisphaerales bacterium]|nr:MAG: corrinoid protein [Phycisphaerales bacterium]